MSESAQLPDPDGPDLQALLGGKTAARAIYRLLYENQNRPMTMLEIRESLGAEVGDQEQLDRRRRDLNPFFVIEKQRVGRDTRYRLVGVRSEPLEDRNISERDRAEVLRWGRCAMCGARALEDGVRLQVDHKIPLAMGGTNDLENLQPLCEPCNRGKKDLLAEYGDLADQIAQAITYEEPQKRIGELLKALDGRWIRSDILEMVAHARQYQEDWQRRMRELRDLGWDYEYRRKREGRRVRTYYKLTKYMPWPPRSIKSEIARLKAERKAS